MPNDPPAGRKRFSAEKAPGLEQHADVSNADVLKALLAMSEGIRTIVAETVADQVADLRQAGRETAGGDDALPFELSLGVRAIVAETVAAQMAEIRAATQREIRELREAALSDGIKALVAETIAAHLDAGPKVDHGPPMTPDDIRILIAEAIAGPMAEIRRIIQEMKDFRDAVLPAVSDTVRATAEAIASQMADIHRITQEIKDIEDASFRGLRKELSDMMAHIDRTKTEIAALKPEDAENNQIVIATNELDAVVEATEAATSEILEQSEKIQDIVQKLRDDCAANRPDSIAPHIDDLEEVGTQLLMSCGFQDLTGQRINKVVNTLLYIEQHIGTMMTIWNIERGTGQSHLMVNAPDDQRPDKDLLEGPQLDGAGVSQDDIDALFG